MSMNNFVNTASVETSTEVGFSALYTNEIKRFDYKKNIIVYACVS